MHDMGLPIRVLKIDLTAMGPHRIIMALTPMATRQALSNVTADRHQGHLLREESPLTTSLMKACCPRCLSLGR